MQLRSSNKYPPHGSKSRSARQCFARLYKKYCSSTVLTIEPRSIAPSLGKDAHSGVLALLRSNVFVRQFGRYELLARETLLRSGRSANQRQAEQQAFLISAGYKLAQGNLLRRAQSVDRPSHIAPTKTSHS